MKIVFDTGGGGPEYPWGDWSLAEGIGGSEEQLILLARDLAILGNQVEVHCRCGTHEGSIMQFDNGGTLTYGIPKSRLEPLDCDALIAWRRYCLLEHRRAPIQLLWCHDIPVSAHCPTPMEIEQGANDNIDGYVLLNQYHAELYKRVEPTSERYVIPITADVRTAAEVERIPGRCIYLSHPDRGLHTLRQLWPEIKRRASHATLAAFWWEPKHFMPQDDDLGILPMRCLGSLELGIEIMKSELLTYPSVFSPEISPASCIKSQIGGAIPVIISASGGMSEVTPWGHKASRDSYVDAVVNALNDQDWQRAVRMPMMNSIYLRHTWQGVTVQWVRLLERLSKDV